MRLFRLWTSLKAKKTINIRAADGEFLCSITADRAVKLAIKRTGQVRLALPGDGDPPDYPAINGVDNRS